MQATNEKRKTLADLVTQIATNINIPFTVGGGISTVADVYTLLSAGADKVSVNSATVRRPELINEIAKEFGSQCLVVAIDAKVISKSWKVHLNGGRLATELDLFDWSRECANRGAGEILFTSMDHDGSKSGFANEALAKISTENTIPIIASGGAGTMQHFYETFTQGKADAALAASIFHFSEIQINTLKSYLKEKGIPIRHSI
jgi:imidazole glycerol-phosphate synthase subunit HisF